MAWPRPWRGGGRAGPESFQVRTAHPALQASFFPEAARASWLPASLQHPEARKASYKALQVPEGTGPNPATKLICSLASDVCGFVMTAPFHSWS